MMIITLLMMIIIIIIKLAPLTMSKVNADIDYAEGDADHDFFCEDAYKLKHSNNIDVDYDRVMVNKMMIIIRRL
jgi:hypothetical protein